MQNLELFAPPGQCGEREALGPQAAVLRGFALDWVERLLPLLAQIERRAAFRNMQTPGGFTMSVGLTNCGTFGWSSDRSGYRYTRTDPLSGCAWPAMPALFLQLAGAAARELGFANYVPDACLINRYLAGARLSLHQDRNENDHTAPVVSVSLGLPATFLFGGQQRADKARRVGLQHGDVVVWGGVDRMRFHGVAPVANGRHCLLGAQRINFTFRKVVAA